jgi:hypothetical protein
LSKVNAQLSEPVAVCRECGHDLKVRLLRKHWSTTTRFKKTFQQGKSDGLVWCSNPKCKHFSTAYLCGHEPNKGQRKEPA